MNFLVRLYALSFFYVTVTSPHIVSHAFQDNNNRLQDINKTIVVDQSGKGNFKTIQSAIDSVPSGNDHWIKIYVREGIYNEKVVIPRDKPKIQMEGNKASETIIQFNEGGEAVTGATFRVLAEYFVAINITFKNTCNQEKPMTPFGEIKIAPAVALVADKAAFFGCGFYSVQDTIGDVLGRHYFEKCHIKGAIDFIWGKGQSIYQSCVIDILGVIKTAKEEQVNRGRLIGGFITAQGRETEQEPNGFVFNECSIIGVGKAFLGRAYRNYSRVIFFNTYMADVIVPQGWDPWSFRGKEDKFTYAEVNCSGPGAKKEKRVTWEKNLSTRDVSYFTNPKTFLDKDGWIRTLPPHPFSFHPPSFDLDENSFG
ncbi:unnamed protein product [Thlaspi arvense]|uniref:pectinesterase n=1 Tax=Thlaspi arvense TaxID=13288 RepID=A0AAU9RPG0_THLAR|nr:unnamed protein product [Thlaspi arvense]